jgi:cephalosporin hydroxylase
VITIDLDKRIVTVRNGAQEHSYDLGTPEAFGVISKAWLNTGWDNKYVYGFTWMGRPIIQLPEDMIRIQEVIHSVRPDVIIETGVAHGGSLIYYASLCKLLERGRVIGVDLDIRPHNRIAIEKHPLSPLITLVEGSSIDPPVVAKVKAETASAESVLVLLDSCHSKAHVLAELRAYAPLVNPGSYIVAMDGIMGEVVGGRNAQPDWNWNNPRQAALEFVKEDANFQIEEPAFPFNEGNITQRVTYWPGAFVKCMKQQKE